MGQSRISMQLAQLKQAGLIDVRRAGQKSLYRMADLQDGDAMLVRTVARGGQGDRAGRAGRSRTAADSRQAEGQASRATSTNWPGDSAATTFPVEAGRAWRRCS